MSTSSESKTSSVTGTDDYEKGTEKEKVLENRGTSEGEKKVKEDSAKEYHKSSPLIRAEDIGWFPFSQSGLTCGIASLISAISVWSAEYADSSSSSKYVLIACELAQAYMMKKEKQIYTIWQNVNQENNTVKGIIYDEKIRSKDRYENEKKKSKNKQKIENEQFKDIEQIDDFVVFFDMLYSEIESVKNIAKRKNVKREVFNTYLNALVGDLGLIVCGRKSLFGPLDNSRAREVLCLSSNSHAIPIDCFKEIRDKIDDMRLNTGDIVQVTAQLMGYVEPHAFLIGRRKSGDWFHFDQGTIPPTVFMAESLSKLMKNIEENFKDIQKGKFTGMGPYYVFLLDRKGIENNYKK